MKKIPLILFLFVVVALSSCKKDTEDIIVFATSVDRAMLSNYFFKPGSWWVYENQNSLLDSVIVTSVWGGYATRFYSYDKDEFYRMEMQSVTQALKFNYYFTSDYIKQNGGGLYGEDGQPVLITDTSYTSFNGAYLEAKYDTLTLAGTTYHQVTKMKIVASEQYRPAFRYDTYLYFAEDAGLIRKETMDTIQGTETWNLIRSHLVQ